MVMIEKTNNNNCNGYISDFVFYDIMTLYKTLALFMWFGWVRSQVLPQKKKRNSDLISDTIPVFPDYRRYFRTHLPTGQNSLVLLRSFQKMLFIWKFPEVKAKQSLAAGDQCSHHVKKAALMKPTQRETELGDRERELETP